LTEALVSADVGETLLEEGPEGVRLVVGLVMRYVLEDLGVESY